MGKSNVLMIVNFLVHECVEILQKSDNEVEGVELRV